MTLDALYDMLLVAQFASAAFVFVALYFITVPYGRHTHTGWGPLVPARPGWVAMELLAVLTITALYATGSITIVGTVFLCLWQLHYIQRTFLFPLLMRGGRGTPVLIVLFSVMFNMMNGWVNGWWLYHRASYDISWLWDPRFIAGLAVFLAGFIINLHSDQVLRTLRKPGETGYKVPMAGLHRFVASPNYFGELLEWTGWALLTWSWAGLAFAVFTAANLVPRAHVHWKWYRSTFPDYPAERRRIIPFIY